MSDLNSRIIVFIAVFGLAAAAVAQETSIHLPPDNPFSKIKAGAGDDAVRSKCMACHSTDYIVLQPRLDAQRWDAEVKKMITVYGARISDADAKIIADYLARNYGPDAAKQPEPLPKRVTIDVTEATTSPSALPRCLATEGVMADAFQVLALADARAGVDRLVDRCGIPILAAASAGERSGVPRVDTPSGRDHTR
jgi:hypothetical protein